MQYLQIDRTNLVVSRLAIGTASIHHLLHQKDRLKLLNRAFESGITHFDTSPLYGYGLSELSLGVFMRGRRSAVTVATKVGLYPPLGVARSGAGVWARKVVGKAFSSRSVPRIDWAVHKAQRSLDSSLRRLGTDYVDILFLHEPDAAIVRSDEFLCWFEAEQSRGRIRTWGIAGAREVVERFISGGHSVARVVQTKDSVERREADFLERYGRRRQFTYGYLSATIRVRSNRLGGEVIRKALKSNLNGSIIFSTRRVDHLQEIIKVAS